MITRTMSLMLQRGLSLDVLWTWVVRVCVRGAGSQMLRLVEANGRGYVLMEGPVHVAPVPSGP